MPTGRQGGEHSQHTETQQWKWGTGTILSPTDCRVYDAQTRLQTNEAQQKCYWMRCNLAYQQKTSKRRYGEKLASKQDKKSSVKESAREKKNLLPFLTGFILFISLSLQIK